MAHEWHVAEVRGLDVRMLPTPRSHATQVNILQGRPSGGRLSFGKEEAPNEQVVRPQLQSSGA